MELTTLILKLLTIALIEVSLSLDNAAVIALRVQHLPTRQRKLATYYGVAGGIVFRALLLFVAGFILSIFWLKVLGGLYLLYIAVKGLASHEEDQSKGSQNGPSFWMTVLIVEFLDLVFSLDNVLAIAAMANLPIIKPTWATLGADMTMLIKSPGFWIATFGTMVGMLAMRFASSIFGDLLQKYPKVGQMALWVILLLGTKIALSGMADWFGWGNVSAVMESHITDGVFSVLTVVLFAYPIIEERLGTHQRAI